MAGPRAAKRAKVMRGTSPGSAGSESESSAEFPVAEDIDALNCGVCFLPLKPPIFQCKVGHVVCSLCRDKPQATGNGKCYVCGIATRYTCRCHAMEHLLETIIVPCPNTSYGCTARPAYHDQHVHSQTCSHTPYRCPGESCGFVGSMGALLGHFASMHGWPCRTRIKIGDSQMCSIDLHDGFNFLHYEDGTSTASSSQYLFVLNVTRQPLGRVISVHCIGPHAIPAGKEVHCRITYTWWFHGPQAASKHKEWQSLSMDVDLESTNLSNGLPNPDARCQLVIPNSLLEDDQETVNVRALFTILDCRSI